MVLLIHMLCYQVILRLDVVINSAGCVLAPYTNVPACKSPVIALSCELIAIKVINTSDNYFQVRRCSLLWLKERNM